MLKHLDKSMSHSNCCVPYCEIPAYHAFQGDLELARQWQVAINPRKAGGELWSPKKGSQICYKHFNAQDFIDPKRLTCSSDSSDPSVRLRSGSIPSRFLSSKSKNALDEEEKIMVSATSSLSSDTSTDGARKRKLKSKTKYSNSPVCKPEARQMLLIEQEEEPESNTETKSMNWNIGNHYPNSEIEVEPIDANREMKNPNVKHEQTDSPPNEGLKIVDVRSMAPTSKQSSPDTTMYYHSVEEKDANQIERKKYYCRRCLRNFTTKDHYLKHALVIPRHLLLCKYCSLTFESMCNREIHELHHALAERYCLQCEIPFLKTNDLQNHFRTCPNATLFIEPKLYSIMDKTERRHKLRIVCKKTVNYFPNMSKAFPSFGCPLCSFSTSLKEVLIGHLQECKSLQIKEDIELICCECRYSTKNKFKFVRHFLHKLSSTECLSEISEDEEESDSNDETIFLDWSESGDMQTTQKPGYSIINETEIGILPPKTTSVIKSSIKVVGPAAHPSVFQCSKCDKNYSSRKNLQEHMTIECIGQNQGAGVASGGRSLHLSSLWKLNW